MPTHKMFHGDCRELLDPLYGEDNPPELVPWTYWPAPSDGGGINVVLTDPPYGMNFQSTYGKDAEAREKFQRKIADDDTPEAAIASFHKTLEAMLPHLADQCEMYVFTDWCVAPAWQNYLESLSVEHGLDLMQLIIWEKGWPGIGDVKYNWGQGHEFIYYLKKGRRPMPKRRSGVIHVDKVRPGTNVHPTQKPVELLKILLEHSASPGDWVFDPYAGSGSTLVAAKEMGMNAIGIERERDYFDAACNRLTEGGLLDLFS